MLTCSVVITHTVAVSSPCGCRAAISVSSACRQSSQWGHADANSFDECFLVALHSAPLPHYHAPPHHTLCQHFPSLYAALEYAGGMCVCLCTHGRECVFSLVLGCLSMWIDSAACHLHFALGLLCGNVSLSAGYLTRDTCKNEGQAIQNSCV